MEKQALKALIVEAFAENAYPGDNCLKNSAEGDEPFRVEEEFKGKLNWRELEPKFIDAAPGG